MGNAIKVCMSKYVTFSGRASRSEFWFFYLFYVIMYIVGTVVATVVGSYAVLYLFIAPFVLPLYAVGVRRIHDTGHSGWLFLVPVYNLVLWIQSGSTSDNSYGPATK